MHKIHTLDDVNVSDQRVLLRLDLNVPIKDGIIIDDERIDKIMPTLRELINKKAKVIICAHLGRPKGLDESLSMQLVATALSKKINRDVALISDYGLAPEMTHDLQPGQVVMLENLRFHEGEEKNDMTFAQQLAELADIYVNDGFSVSHRAHASVEAITHLLPSFAGRLMEREIAALTQAFDNPKEPIIAVVGGSKVSTKLNILKSLAKKAMYIVPAGGIANTFILAHKQQVGKSLCEPDMVDMVLEIENVALHSGCTIIPPSDVVVVESLEAGAVHKICTPQDLHYNDMIVDFGPRTVTDIYKIAQLCRTFIWNGPLGVFEIPPFDNGSVTLANKIASLTSTRDLYTIAGGGETIAVLNRAGVMEKFSYVSTAGGAFLEWIEGKSLPGVEALKKSNVVIKNKSSKVANGN
jgi:phosphoglycerate kinase